jgi:hypothetical protein
MLADSELKKIDDAAKALFLPTATFMRRTAMLDAEKVLQSSQVQRDYRHATRLYSS